MRQILVLIPLALVSLLLIKPAQAAIETYQFETLQQEADYNVLIDELRCLVCQNQNLADSNADLAKDLRTQVYKMITTEQADKETIVSYMVDRYGDFVLYKPPVKNQTYFLWGGPLIFLGLGFWFVFRLFKQANESDDMQENNASDEQTAIKDKD
ncbi:MAG: cytochrome c-type biogenesis protein CcmH [Gammaproteobacteria bacterium]|nr:cytochrome c-type biogenesis protein CcmH [Gammaproteobacteria bacterium]